MKRALRTALIWSLVLGGIGFCCGYLLPLVFSPDANQGPLLGIFVTGPIAAAAGFFSGLIVGAARLSPRAETRALVVAGLATLIASVDAALPQPQVLAMIVDGRLIDCRPVERAVLEEATHQWREPPARGWDAAIDALLRAGPGVIVQLEVQRRRDILQHRRPWNRAVTASGWEDTSYTESFATSVGDCDALVEMLAEPHQVHWEVQAWPPTSAAQLLHRRTLGPTSSAYRDLL